MLHYICKNCKKTSHSSSELEHMTDKRCPHCKAEALYPKPNVPQINYLTGRLEWIPYPDYKRVEQ